MPLHGSQGQGELVMHPHAQYVKDCVHHPLILLMKGGDEAVYKPQRHAGAQGHKNVSRKPIADQEIKGMRRSM